MFLDGYVRLVDEIAERRARLSWNRYSLAQEMARLRVPPLRGRRLPLPLFVARVTVCYN